MSGKGPNAFLKAIGNASKSKGLQKLRWYCQAGLGTFHHVIIVRQNTDQLTTASMVHVAASAVRVTTLTTPGSECNPRRACGHNTVVDDGRYGACNQSDTRE
jgi:hypothetical protein